MATVRNWKRLMPNELISGASKCYKEPFSSSMYVLRVVNKDSGGLDPSALSAE